MNSAPLKITIISIIITLFIILIGSMPEVQASLAALVDKANTFNLTPVENVNKSVPGDVEEVKVNRVVDGDTIVLEDGRTVRFLNIDTPETKKPNTPVMCYGPEASKFTTSQLENRIIKIKPDKEDKDRYGRILRFIFFSGADTSSIDSSFNATLIKQGYARSVTVKPNSTYQKYFEDLELKAKQTKTGLWAACDKPFVT